MLEYVGPQIIGLVEDALRDNLLKEEAIMVIELMNITMNSVTAGSKTIYHCLFGLG